MALIGQTLPSLLDVYSRTDKNGRIAKIVEQLAKKQRCHYRCDLRAV